jgi:hypothetical protein
MSECLDSVGGCALCKRNVPLVESHIIPKFVFRWKKETSATGFLRFSQTPNKRVQDGLKVPMLCIDCEGLFNGFETPFSKRLFYPYISDGGQRLPYDSWLLKFCVSVSWRILSYGFGETELREWNAAQRAAANKATPPIALSFLVLARADVRSLRTGLWTLREMQTDSLLRLVEHGRTGTFAEPV